MKEKSLKERTISGVKWTGASALFTKIISLVKIPILARLLAPSDFGLLGMLQTVLMFSNPLADMGLGSAVIQKKNINHVQLSTLYWLNLAIGLVTFFGLLLAGPLVSDFFKEERLEHLMIFVALIFLMLPLGSQFQRLMEKQLKFGLTTKIDMMSNIVNFCITVVLAYMGWGVYALLYGRLSGAVTSSSLLIFFGLKIHAPGFHFSLKESKGLLSFGGFQLAERFLKILSSNLDKILIGKFLGAEILGYYTIAYTLVVIPIFTLNPLITKVTFPVFSIIQNEHKRINRYFTKAINLLVMMNFPIYAGIIVTAPNFVPLIFGDQWTPSIIIIQILSMEALLWTISNPVGSLLLAKGKADISFILNIFRALSLVLFISLAYYISPSIQSIALAIVLSRYFIDPFIHFYMSKVHGIEYQTILRTISAILLATSGMVGMALAVQLLDISNPYFELSFKIFLGVITYVLLLFVFAKESRNLLLSLRK